VICGYVTRSEASESTILYIRRRHLKLDTTNLTNISKYNFPLWWYVATLHEAKRANRRYYISDDVLSKSNTTNNKYIKIIFWYMRQYYISDVVISNWIQPTINMSKYNFDMFDDIYPPSSFQNGCKRIINISKYNFDISTTIYIHCRRFKNGYNLLINISELYFDMWLHEASESTILYIRRRHLKLNTTN
jgi:hypothetical protein